MRNDHPLSTHLLISIFLLAATPAAASAFNNRTACLNNLNQIGLALRNYLDVHGSFADDIRDERGRPILSWRVRLLPYLDETFLYEQFHLDEPWDSPHNSAWRKRPPPVYCCPSMQPRTGLTPYVKLLGQAQVLLIEVDDDHAIEWSKPGDLNYDPAAPAAGLARRHFSETMRGRGGFVFFFDNKTSFVAADVDSDLLRAFFLDGRDQVVGWPWYRTLFTKPMRFLMAPWLLITLCGAVGFSLGAYRLLKRLPLSPGEMLWFIAGSSQLAHFVAIVCHYRYEPFSRLAADQSCVFWLVPSAVATLASIVALVRYFSVPGWRNLFGIASLLLALNSLLAGETYSGRSPDESFITATSPVVLGLLGCIAAMMTTSAAESSAWAQRRTAHWTGLVVCSMPFILFAICVACGVCGIAIPRDLIGRVRE